VLGQPPDLVNIVLVRQSPESRYAPPAAATLSVLVPDRAALGGILGRLAAAGAVPGAAEDLGVADAVVVRDPDGHAVHLVRPRPRSEWRNQPDGTPDVEPRPLAADTLAAGGAAPSAGDATGVHDALTPLSPSTRQRLTDMRTRLLNLHKVLLDDARAAYELDRGRVGSNASLLQLVINDPWFAWLHPLSELVVRMDETLQAEAAATEADAVALLEHVERLVSAGDGAEGFAPRYREALQRQPAVIMAHAEVRRILKQSK
jgi:hypothetical protein